MGSSKVPEPVDPPPRRGRPAPSPGEDYGLPESPACAFCGGTRTELHSPFGSALSVATYWCNECRTAFEWVKWGPER
jgi:hypothetical protein